MGDISAFGSIVINGVEIATSGASILMDGAAAAETDLEIGMTVLVQGAANESGVVASADQVVFINNLQGPVTSVDTDNLTISALGQTIHYDASTIFDGIEAGDLKSGNVIEVSGVQGVGGAVSATYIRYVTEAYADGNAIEVMGLVSGLNAGGKEFIIGSLTIDYSGAQFTGLNSDELADGITVLVSGNSAVSGNILSATQISSENISPQLPDGASINVKGLIQTSGAAGFTVSGWQAVTDSSTAYVQGDASTLTVGTLIEMIGTASGGTITASRIIFLPQGNLKVQAKVTAVDTAAGTLTVLGKTISVGTRTTFKDIAEPQNRDFSMQEIAVRDKLDILAAVADTETADAMLIKRITADDIVSLNGKVSSVSAPDLDVQGITVSTDENDTEFTDHDGISITYAQFVSAVDMGASVNVTGTLESASTIRASRVEIDETE